MKTLLIAFLLTLAAINAPASENHPVMDHMMKIALLHTTRDESLEFLRYKATQYLRETLPAYPTAAMVFEYNFDPTTKIGREVTYERNAVRYGVALTEILKQFGLTFEILSVDRLIIRDAPEDSLPDSGNSVRAEEPEMVKAEFGRNQLNLEIYDSKQVEAIIHWLDKEKLPTPDYTKLYTTKESISPWVVLEIFKGKTTLERRVELYTKMDSTGETFHTTAAQRRTLLDLLQVHSILADIDATANTENKMSK